jgi:hypothetical protein
VSRYGSVPLAALTLIALPLASAAGAMILGGVVAIFCAVDAEGKSLEDVARPLSVVAKPPGTIFRAGAHDDLNPSAGT